MFQLTDAPIEVTDLAQLTPESTGGIVIFEGRVRNLNQGRNVLRLEYEAYPAMALKEGEKIIHEALEKFAIDRAICVHRVGTLKLKELAVWIAVFAPHRDAAYLASQYIIDEVKTRVPIWKKEHYANDTTDWVKCLTCAAKGIAHHDHFHH